MPACIEPGTYDQGWKTYMAAEIKKHVKIPLIAVANIKEPDAAEAILQEGCCDLVGVARGHLADPAWCNKARAGKAEMISKCIGCLVCFDEIEHGRHVKCSVNPMTGREREFADMRYNGEGRTVVVVGGGPAGFTAAMVLRQRGFDHVTREEGVQSMIRKAAEFGGRIDYCSTTPAPALTDFSTRSPMKTGRRRLR